MEFTDTWVKDATDLLKQLAGMHEANGQRVKGESYKHAAEIVQGHYIMSKVGGIENTKATDQGQGN